MITKNGLENIRNNIKQMKETNEYLKLSNQDLTYIENLLNI